MKISLNWLTDYVDVPVSAQELGDRLTHAGVNCDGIDEVGSDIVFTLDVTSNRPDWLGHVGMAREISAVMGAAFHPPVIPSLPTTGRAADLTSVEVLEPVLCPRYTARVIRGVKVGPSPEWLVEKLASVGMRSVNNVVDVTNFVLMEYSQPLHSFDYDKLAGHRIVVRRARDGETMVAIDGTRCRLTDSMLVIADAARPVAIAGVMGGLDSEVTAGTTNILIESAQFDQLNIRRTSRKLGLMSESNYRFERGIDPVGVDAASLRACQLILELAGGQLADGMVDVWARPYVAPVVTLRPERTNTILGIEIPVARQAELLARLGLSPRMENGGIVCEIPPFRRDLSREIDLIEEVARLHGYDKIPVGGQVTHTVRSEGLTQRTRKQVGAVLSAAGFDEAMTFTFIDAPEAGLFGVDEPMHADPIVRKSNNALRPTLLPSLLRAAKTNQDAGAESLSLFELSAVFPPGGPGGLPNEHVELALMTTQDLQVLRGAIEALLADVSPAASLEIRPSAVAGFADGASAEIVMDGRAAGALGMISPKVRDYYGLERPMAVATIAYESLLAGAGAVRMYKPVPKFPAVRRDLSLIVGEDVTWGQLMQTVAAVPQPMRTGVQYVTTYRGKPIAAGMKSVTMTLTYQSPEGTLRSEQADEQVSQIVARAKSDLSAELRT